MADQEPWLRGTLQEVPSVARAVLHALEMAREDVLAACEGLTPEEIFAKPFGVSPISFHLRHIPGSLDRLLTYAEGGSLGDAQKATMRAELEDGGSSKALFAAFLQGLLVAEQRVRALADADLEQVRKVGKRELPTSVGGLLVHCADHTSRHVGQVVTTAKLLRGQRAA
jgi:uncharacterized damage-inducible protein DinB